MPGTGVEERTRLGRAAVRRWARPGPPGRRRPAPLGSLAAASQRFVAGIARPPEIRRQLAGTGELRTRRASAVDAVAPPRWWAATASMAGRAWSDEAEAAPALPRRGLHSISRLMDTAETHVPGRFASTMSGSELRVRRMAEVAAVGPFAGVTTRLAPPRPDPAGGSNRGGPPGQVPGDGAAHRTASGAAPPPTRNAAPADGADGSPNTPAPRAGAVATVDAAAGQSFSTAHLGAADRAGTPGCRPSPCCVAPGRGRLPQLGPPGLG